jgi:hypothetical protein
MMHVKQDPADKTAHNLDINRQIKDDLNVKLIVPGYINVPCLCKGKPGGCRSGLLLNQIPGWFTRFPFGNLDRTGNADAVRLPPPPAPPFS